MIAYCSVLEQHGLILNPEKNRKTKSQPKNLRPRPKKVEAIQNFPRKLPSTNYLEKTSRFLGMVTGQEIYRYFQLVSKDIQI